MRRSFIALVLAGTASAQSLAVTVMDAQGLSEKEQRKAHAAAVSTLKALSALPVDSEWKGAPRRSCAAVDLGCQRERVRGAGAPAVMGLWLKPDRLEAALFVDTDRVGEPAESVAAALPGWARKGWGGFRLSEALPSGTVLKVDGRVLTARKEEVLPITAGAHQLDVLFPDGSAVLQRIDVAEGSRTRVDATPPTPLGTTTPASAPAVRVTSYALWMVGAATLLSAFVVAFVGRQTASGQNPCTVGSRECVTYAVASEQARAASQYAFSANVLFVTGLGLSLVGAGLFTFDLFKGR